MANDDFSSAVEEARRIDRKAMEYKAYSGGMELEKAIDFTPRDYMDFSYDDLVNYYEKTSKIISTAESLQAYTVKKVAPSKPKIEEKRAEEVVSKLKEITKESLQKAKELEEKEVAAPPEIELEKAEVFGGEIEFEKEGIKPVKPPERKPPVEKIVPEEKPKVAPPKPPEEAPPVEKAAPEVIAPPLPPVLRESPDEAAERTTRQVEGELSKSLGQKIDEKTIKKKMLALTKELFKTKSMNRRQRIKLEIAVLKNMITKKRKAVKGKETLSEKEAHRQLLETIINTQKTEVAANKDTVADNYKKKIAALREDFYRKMGKAKEEEKKRIYEDFVLTLTELIEQLPKALEKYEEFTTKKHTAEIERIKASLKKQDRTTLRKAEERIEEIESTYHDKYAAVKKILAKDVDSLIELIGKRLLKKEGEVVPEEELKSDEIINEINTTDEGTLLYSLHMKDLDYYRRYERKHVSKAEALTRAKILMAREKGLSDSITRRYFGEPEE